ncbi:type II secretion system protein [Patescibacteria group bacterium]|nr:MAG: type II secretion system protein [Patescibacteria group bacterium]
MRRVTSDQKGFTIIELMIATMVFSMVLMLCAAGLITIGRMYQKGNTSRATQEVTRNAMDTIKNDFELSGGAYKALAPLSGSDIRVFCIGGTMYLYELNKPVPTDGSSAGLVQLRGPTGAYFCGLSAVIPGLTPIAALNAGGKELLGTNMRLMQDPITYAYPTATNAQSLQIRINVVYGDDDLINGDLCRGGAGSEWCASSVLETYATRRLQ